MYTSSITIITSIVTIITSNITIYIITVIITIITIIIIIIIIISEAFATGLSYIYWGFYIVCVMNLYSEFPRLLLI